MLFTITTELLQKIIEQLPNYVFVKDTNGRYQCCNKNFAQMLGMNTPSDLQGKTDYDMPWTFHSAEMYIKEDQEIFKTGIEFSNKEVSMVFPASDETRWLSISKKPLYDGANIIGILGIYIDVTEKKRAILLEKEKAIAEKNAEIMNILSSSVAHEMRTPLSVIQINTDLIHMSNVIENIQPPAKRKQFFQYMKNISQAVRESSQVIDMLLVKLKQLVVCEKPSNSSECCFIEKIIRMTLDEYPFRDNEKEKIHYRQETSKNFKFPGHVRLTKHILFNLLRNALHAIAEANKGEIFIESQLGDGFNILIFRDTGAGIPSEYLPKIFNKFETTDDVHSGTGLGLAFCKLVMESYGGKIECRSELGQFTEFRLFFPHLSGELSHAP